MKNIIITLVVAALCMQAQAEDRTLTTTDGVTYTGIAHQRIEPDGLYIEYAVPGGGIGMSKVKFSRLSRAQQKQYGFSKRNARDYEDAVAEANQDAAQDLIHRYEVARDAKRQRDIENAAAYPARMAEITRLCAAQSVDPYLSTPFSDARVPASIGYNTQFTSGRISTQTSYAPVNPDLYPKRNLIVKSH